MCFNFFKKKNSKNEPALWQPESQMPELQQHEQPEVPASTEFNFRLTVENCRIQNGNRQISEPTESDLKQAIMSLKLSDENFVTLESSTPINSINFLQATGYQSEDNTVYAEVQREEKDKGETVFRIYSQTIPIDSLYGLFTAFLAKNAPNIENWDYMMDV